MDLSFDLSDVAIPSPLTYLLVRAEPCIKAWNFSTGVDFPLIALHH